MKGFDGVLYGNVIKALASSDDHIVHHPYQLKVAA